MEFVKSWKTLISEYYIYSYYYICSGVTRYDCYIISSGVRRVSGEARLGSSERLGKSPALEFYNLGKARQLQICYREYPYRDSE